jgi:hypothetical protein
MAQLNWADLVKDAGESASGIYEPIPDGDYDLKVLDASATSTSTGKTMFKMKCEVQGGAFNKRLVWDNLVISPENKNALGIFFAKMEALGIPRNWFLEGNPSSAQIEMTLTGRTFRGNIGSRMYNGEKRNEIKRYYVMPSGAGAVQASAPAPAPAPAFASAPPAPPAPPGPPAPPVAPVASAPAMASAPSDAPF